MIIHTASEGITLSRKLESESAQFYETLAQRYAKGAETFLALAKENKKNITQIERAYYGVISDAIEGCFCFNLDPDDYIPEMTIAEAKGYADALKQAIKVEEIIIKFYTDAAEQSQSLMADVPRTFTLVARKRGERKQKLESLRGG